DLEQILVPQLAEHGALLGDEGATNDGARVSHRANTSWTRLSAADVMTSASHSSSSYALSRSAIVVVRLRMLRHDFHTRSSCSARTSSVRLALRPKVLSTAATAAVLTSVSGS